MFLGVSKKFQDVGVKKKAWKTKGQRNVTDTLYMGHVIKATDLCNLLPGERQRAKEELKYTGYVPCSL